MLKSYERIFSESRSAGQHEVIRYQWAGGFFPGLSTCEIFADFSHAKCLMLCQVSANGARTVINLVIAASVTM